MNLLNRFFATPSSQASAATNLKTAVRRRARMTLESLEGRQLLSTFTVTNLSDNSSVGQPPLRDHPGEPATGTSTINFNIPDQQRHAVRLMGVATTTRSRSNRHCRRSASPVTIDGTSRIRPVSTAPRSIEVSGLEAERLAGRAHDHRQ